MKLLVLLFIFSTAMAIAANPDLEKMIATERLFADRASEKSTREAFLEFAAKDGVLFLPDRINAIEYWKGRSPSTSLLSWAPNYADISSNGLMGYTTGNWEFRPKGKGGPPEGFGEFITVWVRQVDGNYRFVVDIGVEHDRPKEYLTGLTNTRPAYQTPIVDRRSAADSSNAFYATIYSKGLANAYENFATNAILAFREGRMPIVGKKDLVSHIKKDKGKYELAKRSTFFETADLAYNTNTYRKLVDGKFVEKGNALQIWKLIDGKWRLVLDIFKPVP